MRLEVTRRSDLAVRTLLALATHDAKLTAVELGELIDASPKFVPHAVGPLVNAGWVRSEPGPAGGYRLAADLDDVSVCDVIEAVDGPIDSGRCVIAKRPCTETAPCALHAAWTDARRHLVDDLRATPIAALANRVRVDGAAIDTVPRRTPAGRSRRR